MTGAARRASSVTSRSLLLVGALCGAAAAQGDPPSKAGMPEEAALRLRGRKLDTRASLYDGTANLAANGWENRDRELRQLGLETLEPSAPEILDPAMLRARALALHGVRDEALPPDANAPEPLVRPVPAPAPAQPATFRTPLDAVIGGVIAGVGALLLLGMRRRKRANAAGVAEP